MTAKDATRLLADEAELRGGTANDADDIVRGIVTAHGLGFYAWFCVCCELADRAARRQGFDNEVHRALTVARQNLAERVDPS
jgi:hypothetical protein